MNIELLFNGFLNDIELPIRSEEELIRIEKKLKLQEKLYQNIDKNEISTILKLIKEHPHELKYLINEKNLVNFLLKKHYKYTSATSFKSEFEAIQFTKFLNLFFLQDFKESVSYFLTTKKYNQIYFLSYYIQILPLYFLEYINILFLDKLDFAINIVDSEIQFEKLEQKINYISEIDFIDLLSVYSSYGIEEKIRKLFILTTNDIYEKKHSFRHDFYYKYFLALTDFHCYDEDLRNAIEHYCQIALTRKTIYTSKVDGFKIMGILFYFVALLIIITAIYSLICHLL